MTRLRDRGDQLNSERLPASPPGGLGGGNLERLRHEGQEILAAGNEAINRALSGDAAAFLQANRQQGGQ